MNTTSNVVSLARDPHRPASETDPHWNPFPEQSKLYFSVVPALVHYKEPNGGLHFKPYYMHKVLCRIDHESQYVPIAIVGKGYQILQNRELFQGVERHLLHTFSVNQLMNVIVMDSMSHEGKNCYRQYIFPGVGVTTAHGEVNLRIIVVNSFGEKSFKLIIGAIDGFCENGMIIGEYNITTRKHTSGLVVSSVVKNLDRIIPMFLSSVEQWKKWQDMPVHDEQVLKCFKSLPDISTRRADQLFGRYVLETYTRASTVWAAYSALTYYASHDSAEFPMRRTTQNHQASTMMNRELQVLKWTHSKAWAKLLKEAGT